ncbi:SMI1/KNR4 family protein [Orbus wheelerorum]|uniref:SMI1/KNR4 family protein n=1 Tax=Orbus wheelerorum TaxID=3074111 RepID=UPI00370D6B87
MSIKDVKDAINIINEDIDLADFIGEISPDLIDKAEGMLGVKFPESYKYFLENLGCGDIYGQEFYGIIKADFINSGIPDAIWITLKMREESGLPDYFVIVYFGGDGDYYAIDCRDPNKAPLICWMPGESKYDGLHTKIANDFGIFFKETILNAKENW